MELGTLKVVRARNKWNHEARDFTPWLAENIDKLSDVIGIELEVENTEVSVGPYSADILAKNTVTDEYVIIENQLEKTDHDHLGKAITYASVLDAAVIIWIATDFTEEHKKSLDWLNEHTVQDILFFGVQLELWQIDDSNPALKFNIVSEPNQAVRQAARSKYVNSITEKGKLLLSFWKEFKEKLDKEDGVSSARTPSTRPYFDIALGRSHIHFSNICNVDDNLVAVRVYIRHSIADTMYPYLESNKAEIEAHIGHPLIWNPKPNNRDRLIVLFHPTDFNNKQSIAEAIEWLVRYTIKFKEIFSQLIRLAP